MRAIESIKQSAMRRYFSAVDAASQWQFPADSERFGTRKQVLTCGETYSQSSPDSEEKLSEWRRNMLRVRSSRIVGLY